MKVHNQLATANKVLILGFAREGKSTYQYLRQKFPKIQISIADQNVNGSCPDPDTTCNFGPNYLNALDNPYDLIFKTPGISPHLPKIKSSQKNGAIFSSHLELFFELVNRNHTIGITGTKGKSTTSSLIYHVLGKNRIKSILIGNIGLPALDYLDKVDKDTWIVCELSSYQLMQMHFSPHIAVLQNIYPDHLDYHKSFAEYKQAKLNISKFQSQDDYLITQTNIPTSAQKILISADDWDPNIKTHLMGVHNHLNIIPSIVIGKLLGLSKDQIYSAISTFKPLETRLELVAEFNSVRYYSDTLATIPEATIAAINTLNPNVLIAGGHDREQNFKSLAKVISKSTIHTLILFPATGSRLAKTVMEFTPNIEIHFANSMKEAVDLAVRESLPGQTCLLSPAAPSFTLFKDYKDERQQFISNLTYHSRPQL